MLLSVALTAPLYVAKAVSRKPWLMAGRDAGGEHATTPLRGSEMRAASQAQTKPQRQPMTSRCRRRRRSRTSMPETI